MPGSSAGRGTARLSAPGSPVCTPGWLALREPADAAARATELVDDFLAAGRGPAPEPPAPGRSGEPLLIRDLGCGTGSLARWLAPRLPGPQTWVLHDRDAALLAEAQTPMPASAADGSPVRARARLGDLTALGAADLAGTSLVTCSALLDLLSGPEVDALAAACVDAGCAALFTLSVSGSVVLTPPDPLDGALAAAFDAHQRRETGGRRLLGPDAGAAAADAFARRGASVTVRPSPWRLGPGEAALAEEWLRGWIDAACVQEPDLRREAGSYLRRRLESCAAGELWVVVGHVDLLALPAGGAG